MRRFGFLTLVLALGGCDLGDRDNKIALSTLLGVGVGGVIGWFGSGSSSFGYQFLHAGIFAGGGGVTGYYLAKYLLPPDRDKLESTAYNALNNGKSGETVAWGDKATGTWGTFTPTRDFTDRDGRSCRDYVATINVRGESGKIEESACRLDDGAWRTLAI